MIFHHHLSSSSSSSSIFRIRTTITIIFYVISQCSDLSMQLSRMAPGGKHRQRESTRSEAESTIGYKDLFDNHESQSWNAHPWHDDSLNVLKHVVPRFRVSRRLVWYQFTQVARFHVRQWTPVSDVFQVIRHVVHHLLPSLPELFRVHDVTAHTVETYIRERGQLTISRETIIHYPLTSKVPHFSFQSHH